MRINRNSQDDGEMNSDESCFESVLKADPSECDNLRCLDIYVCAATVDLYIVKLGVESWNDNHETIRYSPVFRRDSRHLQYRL